MDAITALRLFRAGEGKTYRLDSLTLTFKHHGDVGTCGYCVCMAASEADWPGARLHRHGDEEWHIQLDGQGD